MASTNAAGCYEARQPSLAALRLDGGWRKIWIRGLSSGTCHQRLTNMSRSTHSADLIKSNYHYYYCHRPSPPILRYTGNLCEENQAPAWPSLSPTRSWKASDMRKVSGLKLGTWGREGCLSRTDILAQEITHGLLGLKYINLTRILSTSAGEAIIGLTAVGLKSRPEQVRRWLNDMSRHRLGSYISASRSILTFCDKWDTKNVTGNFKVRI
jgi:hypothetical protein